MNYPTSDRPHDGALEQKKPLPIFSRRSWGLLIGGAFVLSGGAWGMLQLTRSSNSQLAVAAPAIPVETLTLRAKPVVNTLDLSGTIRPLEQAVLSTRVTGRIKHLSLEAGDRFQKGDILVRVDVADFAAKTNQERSRVAQARAELARSQANLSQLKSQAVEAQASLRLVQINQRRTAQLRAAGAVSQLQLDEVNTHVEETRAKVAQIEAGVQQSRAAISQSRSAVEQAISGVTSASVSENYGTVIAPFNGVVVQKLAYEGEIADSTTSLLKVENPNRLQLEISVPEENLRFVRIGQAVQVKVDAASYDYTATIQQIVPSADSTSRSFLVKIPLSHSGQIISGMFGRIALPLDETQKTIFIPSNALIRRGQLQGVYVVQANTSRVTATLRWVKTGKIQNGQVSIVSGLVEGDRIITSKISQLSDGQPIVIRQ